MSRYVWNRTLAWRHAWYHGEQVKTNFTQANAYLTAMKATEDLAWLNEVSSVPLQQAIRHQQVAYTNFFARRARYPRFKSRTGRQSAEYTRSGFRYRDGQLFLAKMDTPLVFVWSWPDIDPAGIDPSTVTVSRDLCGRWYVRASRADFLHRASTRLVRDHDVIVIEDLAVKNMVRNRSLAKAISDCGWGTFRAMAEYKAARAGRHLMS